VTTRVAVLAMLLCLGCDSFVPCGMLQFRDGTHGLSCGGPRPFVCYVEDGACFWFPGAP